MGSPRLSPASALALFLALWAAGSLVLRPAPRPAARAPPPRALVPDVNRAPAHQLLLLPNIGPKRAAAIVAERERSGPFESLDDLRRVHGIGPVTARGLHGWVRQR